MTTGILLTTHYTPHVLEAFDSVVGIMRNLQGGWAIRGFHANGASFFFLFVFFHIGRGVFYHSFFLAKTWVIGVHIFLLLMIVAFTGYVLPWGQMSYWAATVITNLVTAIPFIGGSLVEFIWGGATVCDATLKRFFAFHVLGPFLLALLAALHMLYLHEDGSSNPLGVKTASESTPFHPLFTYKDVLGMAVLVGAISMVVLVKPDMFTDPENFMPADPTKTPVHIQPEWYFLFAYSILRSVPNKLGGVVLLLSSVLVLYTLPFCMKPKIKGTQHNYAGKILFWVFVTNFFCLTSLGACSVEYPFDLAPIFCTLYYFGFFLLYSPCCYMWEKMVIMACTNFKGGQEEGATLNEVPSTTVSLAKVESSISKRRKAVISALNKK
uniref:cytochrome b n=1 Tax=Nototeredo knoxi TaxID=2939324 RepID=UPI002029138B|nr:cytochrome b [Nototeredo knoxi]UPX89283.1 cytochrome b [Nototeredo knoxi]